MAQLLTILGPNLRRPLCDKGEIHIHAAGCADLKRGGYQHVHSSDQCDEEHDSIKSVVESFFGPAAGGFYEESGCYETPEQYAAAWKDYLGEFYFAPCVHLPDEIGVVEIDTSEPLTFSGGPDYSVNHG